MKSKCIKITIVLVVAFIGMQNVMAQNPIIRHVRTADPSAHIWDESGTLWIYTSGDPDRINSDPEAPGFQNIVFKPNFIQAMGFAKGSYNSIYGEIKAEWKKVAANTYEYKIEVPANCKAKVILPNKQDEVKSGKYVYSIKL
jgi:hypothetical protein